MSKWRKKLEGEGKGAVLRAFEDLLVQIPEGAARSAYELALNSLAAPTADEQKMFEKLNALENAGVDNWEGYREALDEAGFSDDEDDDDEEEEEEDLDDDSEDEDEA